MGTKPASYKSRLYDDITRLRYEREYAAKRLRDAAKTHVKEGMIKFDFNPSVVHRLLADQYRAEKLAENMSLMFW